MLSRNKFHLLLLIFGPVILMAAIGVGLSDNGLNNVPGIVYFEGETEFVTEFISAMEAGSFIVETTSSRDYCLEQVRLSEKTLCVELVQQDISVPDEFSNVGKGDIEKSGIGYSVELHVDFSQPRIVWGIIAQINTIVDQFSDAIRVTSSDVIKQEFDSFAEDLKGFQEIVSKAIQRLEVVEGQLLLVDDFMPSTSNVASIGAEINSIGAEIAVISTFFPAEQQEIFGPILSSHANLQQLWNTAGFTTINQGLSFVYQAEAEVSSLQSLLINLNAQIGNLIDETEEVGELNWDYVLHPIPLSYHAISGESVGNTGELGFLDYLFPSLLSFFIVLSSLFLSVHLILRERKSTAHIRNVLSKSGSVSFLLADYMTILFLVFVQVAAILLIATQFISFSILSGLSFFILTFFLSTSIFIFLGFVLGNLFDSSEIALISSVAVSLLFIIFSSLITPLETLPSLIKSIVSYTPLFITESLFRKNFIFDSGFGTNSLQIGILTLIFLGVFILSYISKVHVRRQEEGH